MLRVFAPAKVNLHLHVTGRQNDGYHQLDSLVAFADVGDTLTFNRAREFSFSVEGPFASAFTGAELDTSPQSKNLVVRAAWQLANLLARELGVGITLNKQLPLGAGLGGGSADAAACLWGLCQLWDVNLPESHRTSLALQLGRDVPVCLKSQSHIMQGTGEILMPAPDLPELPVVLVWPNQPISTQAVFTSLELNAFSAPAKLQPHYDSIMTLCVDLGSKTSNDLTKAACTALPLIDTVLAAITDTADCLLARMSGSGSSCFGIYADEDAATAALEKIKMSHPDWWVKAGILNRVSRY